MSLQHYDDPGSWGSEIAGGAPPGGSFGGAGPSQADSPFTTGGPLPKTTGTGLPPPPASTSATTGTGSGAAASAAAGAQGPIQTLPNGAVAGVPGPGGFPGAIPTTPAADPALGNPLNASIMSGLQGILNGSQSRYNPAAVSAMTSGVVSTAAGQEKAAEDAIRQDAARRGMSDAGATGEEIAGALRQKAQSISTGAQQIAIQKANADMEDKLNALDRAQTWLDARRDFILRSDATDAQKQVALSQIALGYSNIQEQYYQVNQQFRPISSTSASGQTTNLDPRLLQLLLGTGF